MAKIALATSDKWVILTESQYKRLFIGKAVINENAGISLKHFQIEVEKRERANEYKRVFGNLRH